MALLKDLATRIKNIAGDQEETTLTTEDPILTAILSGEAITREMAMSIPRVSSSVRKITDTVSMVSFKLYRRETDSTGKHKVKEVFDDSRLRIINSDTGDTLDAVQFKKALVKDYLLGQGGYAYINRSGNTVLSLHYIKDSNLSFYKNQDQIFKSYSILLDGRRYFEHDFFKILRNTTNGYSGEGVLNEISKAIEAAYSSLTYMLRLTKTGGVKKGFILAEKKLTDEAITRLKESWRRMYSQDTENVVVLNNNLKFQDASQTSMDMQLMQIRTTLNNDIIEAFGIEKTDEDYLKYTITPILQAIESALNRYLLLESEKEELFWKADTRELDKMDAAKRYTALTTATKGGLMTINEARYKENMPEQEGLDIIPMSLGTTFFDIKSGQFYTPNTGQIGSASTSGEGGD